MKSISVFGRLDSLNYATDFNAVCINRDFV